MRGDQVRRGPSLVVGITGGIGSGKSTVASQFEALGVVVIDADHLAREVVAPGSAGIAAIVARLGVEILDQDGALDRRALRDRVFADEDLRRWLEGLLHPGIRALMLERLEDIEAPYAMLAIPLLVEAGQHPLVDRILVVDVPESVQIERTTRRDATDPAAVRAIMTRQASREERLRAADDVLDNRGDPESLAARVLALHERYLGLACAVESPSDSVKE